MDKIKKFLIKHPWIKTMILVSLPISLLLPLTGMLVGLLFVLCNISKYRAVKIVCYAIIVFYCIATVYYLWDIILKQYGEMLYFSIFNR